jgi:plasmid stabilization system protein ParE
VTEVLCHLARNPEMGRERPEWGEGVRSFLFERHILIYRIYGSTVEISRILRQNQDIETELGLRESESFE